MKDAHWFSWQNKPTMLWELYTSIPISCATSMEKLLGNCIRVCMLVYVCYLSLPMKYPTYSNHLLLKMDSDKASMDSLKSNNWWGSEYFFFFNKDLDCDYKGFALPNWIKWLDILTEAFSPSFTIVIIKSYTFWTGTHKSRLKIHIINSSATAS